MQAHTQGLTHISDIPRVHPQTRNLFGGVGGVFHGAIVIKEVEYSFGYCVSHHQLVCIQK